MRHRKFGLKLNRTASHRDAMFRNMVTSLFKHQRIRTTDTKAKEVRRWADHLITLAKRGDLHARRQAMAIIREKDVVHKLFEEAPSRFGGAAGGYTRIVKIGPRPGDAAPVSLVEFVFSEPQSAKPKKKTTKRKAKTTALKKKVAKGKAAAEAETAAPEDAGDKTATEEPEEPEKKKKSGKTKSAAEAGKPAAPKKSKAKKAEKEDDKAASDQVDPSTEVGKES